MSFRRSRSFMAPLVAALLVSSTLFACAGGGSSGEKAPRRYKIKHEYELVPGKAHHPGIERALIFPPNATVEPVAGLDVANGDLLRLLSEFLAAQGVATTELSVNDYNRSTRAAVAEARKRMMSGESGTTSDKLKFSDIIPGMLEELESDVQIVILPNVVIRTAEYKGGQALRWDGVRRRERGTRGGHMKGTTGAGSLYTMIYDRDGERLFEGYGGLDLIYELDMTAKKYVVREDLFEDLENLAEGVCISLNPWIATVDC